MCAHVSITKDQTATISKTAETKKTKKVRIRKRRTKHKAEEKKTDETIYTHILYGKAKKYEHCTQ